MSVQNLYVKTVELLKGFLIDSKDERIRQDAKLYKLPFSEPIESFSLQYYKNSKDRKTVIKCRTNESTVQVGLWTKICEKIERELNDFNIEKQAVNGKFFTWLNVEKVTESDIIPIIESFSLQLKDFPDNNEHTSDELNAKDVCNANIKPSPNKFISRNIIKYNNALEFVKSMPDDKNWFEQLVRDVFKGILNLKISDRLIWPIYSPIAKENASDPTRTSEQELRQQFIKELSGKIKHENSGLCYSVETPTIDGYAFKNSEFPIIKHHYDKGQSARFDLTVYSSNPVLVNKYDILSHIEFKQGNGDRQEFTKDLLKLANEPFCPLLDAEKRSIVENHYGTDLKNRTHYFIHLINGFDTKTLLSLTCKYFGLDDNYNLNHTDDYQLINQCLFGNEKTCGLIIRLLSMF